MPPALAGEIMTPAPLAIFAYRRPQHLERCLYSLSCDTQAQNSEVHIFCDGAKSQSDAAAVAETRRIARTASGFRAVHVVEQAENRGLANSVISGVSDLCERHGRVIVVEDDLFVAPCFLSYMNDALERFVSEGRVMQIAGYTFPIEPSYRNKSVLLPFISSWGWATWQRAWRHFDPSMRDHAALAKSARLRRRFDLDGSYDYFAMLERQLRGEIDSWAIRWHLSCFMRNGLTLYPGTTLVHNLGFDGSGTHTGPGNTYPVVPDLPAADHRFAFPTKLRTDEKAFDQVKRVLRPAPKSIGAIKRITDIWR